MVGKSLQRGCDWLVWYHLLNSNLEIFNKTPEIHDPGSLHLPLGQRIIQTDIKEALKCSLVLIQTHRKRPKSLGKTSNLHSLLFQSLMSSHSLLPCGRRGYSMSIVPTKATNKLLDLILAAVFCHGMTPGKQDRSKCSF